jgi:hypothetical protein
MLQSMLPAERLTKLGVLPKPPALRLLVAPKLAKPPVP